MTIITTHKSAISDLTAVIDDDGGLTIRQGESLVYLIGDEIRPMLRDIRELLKLNKRK